MNSWAILWTLSTTAVAAPPATPAVTPAAVQVALATPTADAAVKRIEELNGEITYDEAKDVVAIDLSERVTTDKDVLLFQAFPKLKKLVLWGAEIGDEGAKNAAQLTGLVDLTLENTNLTADGVAALKPLKNLKSLNLRRSTYLTDDALVHLADLPSLELVHLLYNNFSDAGLAHLSKLTKIRLLDLRGCAFVTDAGMAHLKDLTNMVALKLRCPSVTDEGMKNIAGMSKLKTIACEDMAISDASVEALAALPALSDVAIFRCYGVTEGSLAHLVKLPLTKLSLRDLGVGDEGLKSIGKLTKLTLLDLSENTTITDAGLAELTGLVNLERLELWHTSVTDAGLASLVKLPKLKTLVLEDIRITDAGLKTLAKLPALETL
ncbi:MAG TPA: hypothetical protein VGE52_10630, partial [Pirellulales bacterium]